MASALSDDRIRRLFNLHKILRTGRACTKAELMEELKDSLPFTNERNLLSDIAFLRKLGADIPPGHKHVAFRYRKPFSFLSASNQLDFNEVEEVLAFFRQLYARMPQSGFLNLDRMYLALQNRADLMTGITVDNMEFQDVEYEGEKWIGPLLKLMREKCVLSFFYKPFGSQESKRLLYPLLLKEYNNRWFLIGLNPELGRLENIALDRITSSPFREDIAFHPLEIPDLRMLFRDVLGVSLEGGPASRICIRIRKPRAFYVKTKPWHPSQKMESEDDHSMVFTWHLHQNRELKTRVMEYLPDAEVLEPAELRDWTKAVLKEYFERVFPEP
jgi:predicted DNA-binding transcriptional regulator YafY